MVNIKWVVVGAPGGSVGWDDHSDRLRISPISCVMMTTLGPPTPSGPFLPLGAQLWVGGLGLKIVFWPLKWYVSLVPFLELACY